MLRAGGAGVRAVAVGRAPVLLVWGVSVIADSGLFSSCVADVVDPRYVGTALTTQTALGFLLTVVTINAVPWVVGHVGWRWAVLLLAVGPVAGAVAMARLDVLLRPPRRGQARVGIAGDARPPRRPAPTRTTSACAEPCIARRGARRRGR